MATTTKKDEKAEATAKGDERKVESEKDDEGLTTEQKSGQGPIGGTEKDDITKAVDFLKRERDAGEGSVRLPRIGSKDKDGDKTVKGLKQAIVNPSGNKAIQTYHGADVSGLPSSPIDWPVYKVEGGDVVKMTRIEGAFGLEDADGNATYCADGFLCLDRSGTITAVTFEESEKFYEPV